MIATSSTAPYGAALLASASAGLKTPRVLSFHQIKGIPLQSSRRKGYPSFQSTLHRVDGCILDSPHCLESASLSWVLVSVQHCYLPLGEQAAEVLATVDERKEQREDCPIPGWYEGGNGDALGLLCLACHGERCDMTQPGHSLPHHAPWMSIGVSRLRDRMYVRPRTMPRDVCE